MPDLLNRKRPNGHLNIESRRVEAFKPNPKNARSHSRSQIKAIAESIGQFGFLNPILVDNDGMILAGHGRFEAAKLLGLSEIPSIRICELNEAQKRAYVLADNKLAERAGWDRELLAIELGELSVMLPDIGLSIELTGFEIGEIEAIKPKARKTRTARTVAVEDDIVEPPTVPVTRPGEIWTLGCHRVVCGDPRQRAAFAALLGDERADLVFTDIPSNVLAEACNSTRASEDADPAQATEIASGAGRPSEAGLRTFLRQMLAHAAAVSRSGAVHHVSTPWWHVADLIEAGRLVYGAPSGMWAWTDDKADKRWSGSALYELMVMFPVKGAKTAEQVGLAPPLIHQIPSGRLYPLASGRTRKSVGAVAEALKEISDQNALVLDPFGARGTTLLAAERTRRRARLIAPDAHDVDVAVLRYQALTGCDAVHAATGDTFATIAQARETSAVAALETDNG